MSLPKQEPHWQWSGLKHLWENQRTFGSVLLETCLQNMITQNICWFMRWQTVQLKVFPSTVTGSNPFALFSANMSCTGKSSCVVFSVFCLALFHSSVVVWESQYFPGFFINQKSCSSHLIRVIHSHVTDILLRDSAPWYLLHLEVLHLFLYCWKGRNLMKSTCQCCLESW